MRDIFNLSATPTMPVVVQPLLTFLQEQSDADEYGRDPFLHISQMYYMCPRAEVAITLTGQKESITPALAAKFDIGHAMHHWYQNKYLGPMGVLIGTWKCVRCLKTFEGPMPETKGCQDEHGHVWEYVEKQCVLPKYGIIGKTDGIIERGDGAWVMDLKTQDPYLFSKCTEPYEAHKMQVNLYMEALGISRGLVVYIDKSANDKNFPCKEFRVDKDQALLDSAYEKARAYWNALKTGEMPECTCPEKKKKKCPSCQSGVDFGLLLKAKIKDGAITIPEGVDC